MSNIQINFSHPWLLLLLIPAALLTVIPYFRLDKRYRKTRNRIISMILHSIIMLLCISVLAGVSFSYDKTNSENEILLLVDVSSSGKNSEQRKNNFIQAFLEECDSVRVGLVTFGYDQIYASPIDHNASRVYSDYRNAKLPDTSATDVEAALNYAATLFEKPETAKIVLLSEGLETDGKARNAIKNVSVGGIRVDTVYFPDEPDEAEVQLIGVEMPDYNVAVGADFQVQLSVQSSYEGKAKVTLLDNGTKQKPVEVTLGKGIANIELTHSVTTPGMHQFSFEISCDKDAVLLNNSYSSYIILNKFNEILILESIAGESDRLKDALERLKDNPEEKLNVTVRSIHTEAPQSLKELCDFDEVILVNIANSDLPQGFDQILSDYVSRKGGGLFTVGGSDPVTKKPHTYVRDDMYGSLYQQMLPVQAINYTPPIGVMILIDRSGSMDSNDGGKSKLTLAKEGAQECVNGLSERDWCGVISLDDNAVDEVALIPATRKYEIKETIEAIQLGGGTAYTPALDSAGSALSILTGVERKHIILVTDGMPGDSYKSYSSVIERNYEEYGITFSVLSIGSASFENLQKAAELGHGTCYSVDYGDYNTIPEVMAAELKQPSLQEIKFDEKGFQPTVKSHTAVVEGIDEANMPTLYGYYGTKAKADAEVSLIAQYVPLYAQWKYGKGTVGSFMCDLNGKWSGTFLANASGTRILSNIITGLLPIENIRMSDIDVELIEENYTTRVNIYTGLAEHEQIEMDVQLMVNGADQRSVSNVRLSENYTRLSYPVRESGIYHIRIRKLDADNQEIGRAHV